MSNTPSHSQDRYKLKLLIIAKGNCNILGSSKAFPVRKVRLMLSFHFLPAKISSAVKLH